MENYLNNWVNIIKDCSFDNTYKMAWAKSIVEISVEKNENSENVSIHFEEIAKKVLKYYWNQTIFFDLIQGSNLKKIPEIVTATKYLIDYYQNEENDMAPIKYEKIEHYFEKDNYQKIYSKTIKKVISVLKSDVCWRFMKLGKKEIPLYNLDKKNAIIYFNHNNLKNIADNAEIFFQIINYRWTQMLESFNTSPKIAMKVRSTHEKGDIRRTNLSKFHKDLDMEFDKPTRTCFYCGLIISDEDLSVDHVIPWSYMYSDDIWNLVYCHKNENSSKSNRAVDENIILKLENRNRILIEKMKEENIISKRCDELILANEHNFVRKFWISSKG